MSMSARKRLVWAFALSLALVLTCGVQRRRSSAREADKALFQAYLQGPLSELLLGVSRSLPLLLAKAQPQPGAWAEPRAALERSVIDLEALLKDRPAGPWVQSLGVVLESHRAYAALASRWKSLQGPARTAYLKDEEELRLKLSHQLDVLRGEAMDKQRWRKAEWLELNALLYSLRNAKEGLGKRP